MAYSDAVDSYFQFVKARILEMNPTRKVVAVQEAMDWPPKNVDLESFYLLILNDAPIGKDFDSASIPTLSIQMQWVWAIVGADLQSPSIGRNRGNKYRVNQTMKGELLYGGFPRYCEKLTYSVDGGGTLVSASLVPQEFIWWGPLRFNQRNDRASGTIYGTGSVSLVNMSDQIAA